MNNEIGVRITYTNETNLVERFERAKEMELASCQLCVWDEELFSYESAERVNEAITKT